MKITRIIKAEQDIRYLKASMGVRYWVDCEYSKDNGQTWEKDFEDTTEESDRVREELPCVVKKDIGYGSCYYWEIIIDLNDGKILNWPKGFCLNTHFKVCDDGEYVFLDDEQNEVVNITKEYKQYYVPHFLALEDSGYGDYVYIDINGDGKINKFNYMKERIVDYFDDLEDDI